MKNLKKILAVAMALAMCLSISVIGASAAEISNIDTDGDAMVYYQAGNPLDDKGTDDPTDDEVEGTYKVTIPEYIVAAAKDGTPETEDVVITEALLLPATTLSVACEYSGELTLKEDNNVKLAYEMQNNGTVFATGDVVVSVDAGDPFATTSTEIGAQLTADPLFAGTYTDTTTFTASVA